LTRRRIGVNLTLTVRFTFTPKPRPKMTLSEVKANYEKSTITREVFTLREVIHMFVQKRMNYHGQRVTNPAHVAKLSLDNF